MIETPYSYRNWMFFGFDQLLLQVNGRISTIVSPLTTLMKKKVKLELFEKMWEELQSAQRPFNFCPSSHVAEEWCRICGVL